ncbi:MAG: DEAD/DEAH box helicase, partial [Vulcanimicrobiota bacterium]
MKAALDLFKNSSIYNRIKKAINDGKSLDLSGVTPTFKPFLLSGLSLSGSRGLLWITSSWDNCEKLFENTYPFFPEGINNRLGVFPALGKAGNQELTPALRMKILEMLNDKRPVYIIAPFKALLQECETPGALKEDSLLFKTGENQPMEAVQNQLESMGYSRNYQVEKRGEYSRRGGILDVYPSTYNPVRIEFFGDEVDSIRHFDLDSQISTEKIRQIRIYPLHETRAKSKLLDIIGKDYTLVVDDPSVIKFHATEWDMEEGRDLWNDFLYEMKDKPTINVASWDSPLEGAIDLNTRPLDSMGGNIEKLLENTHKWQENNEAIVISTQHHKRLKKLMLEKNIPDVSTNPQKTAEPGQIILLPGDFTTGFLWQDVNLRFVTDKEILGRTPRKKRVLRAWDKTKAIDLEELKPGELVVHLSHGLGKFVRLAHLVIQGVTRDFVELEYKNNDKLFVPVQQLDLLQKYIGLENRAATLNRLGGSDWKRTRSRAKKAADEMADELIKLYSERERAVGYKFSPDTSWQLELEASFPFDETEDQTKAIDEVKKAMESTRPMDFLLCGDAGYGKTEVALRAAFKAVQDGKQVAMISPTTILTSQHFETFSDRLKTFPAHVGLLSRFRSRKEQRDTINRLATREVDIVIGTHRLLQKDIMFSDLGLVIVDEEQHFGVKHKEKLKKLKVNVDVLTMTATPIPRTLHMAMSGLRDLVVIETPPEDRLPIKTYLHEYDSELIRSLIVREMERGGQVYFVHNRVHN